jgi:iron(III) transport system substrate-binding protein
MLKRLACAMAGLLLASALGAGGDGASAQTLSAVEKYYADLATLPAAEREKRMMEGAAKEKAAVLLSTTPGPRGVAHLNLFHAKYPNVKIERGELNSPVALERLIAEEAANRHLSDGLSAGVQDVGSVVEDHDLVARYPTPVTARVLPQYRGLLDPQNRWLPWFTAEHGLSFNTNLIKPEEGPKEWADLCNPKFKGMASYDPFDAGFLAGLYSMLGEEETRKLIECIGKNEPLIQMGHTQRMALMLAGEHAMQGDGFLFIGELEVRKNPGKVPFKAVYSAPVLVNAEGFLINKNAPNPNGVALFADFLLSDETQKFVSEQFRGPMTLPHPYFPAEAKIINVERLDKATRDRLQKYWEQYVGKKR